MCDWLFHSWSENTEEFSILGLNVPNSSYGHLLLLVKVMIHISSLSRSFYIRHITEITLLSWLFSCSIMSDFLGPSGLQHNRLCCASVSHRDYPSSCPLNRWCHPTISTSVALFSFSLQSFPASGSSPMSHLLTSGGRSIGVQFQHQSFQWTPRTDRLQNGLVGSPCSPRDSQESSPTPQFKSINSSALSLFTVQLSHPYMTTGKAIALTRQTFVGKATSLLFNMLSRLVINFLPRSKCLLSSWLQSPSTVIFVP